MGETIINQTQLKLLVEALDPSWVGYLYWWSQILLTAIAAASAYFAYGQLKNIAASRGDAVHIARATFLLELDRRWDGTEMVAARKLLSKTLGEAKETVSRANHLANDGERERLVGIEFSRTLAALRSTDTDAYQALMSICGFFETAGLMVKRGYVPADDLISLFGGPLATAGTCYRSHIQDRQNETGVLAGLYEHALDLAAKVSPRPSR